MKGIKLLYIAALIGVFASCSKESTYELGNVGHDYIVDKIGHYVIYQVDSTVYNDFDETVRDTTLQFKEVISEVFIDNVGREAHRVLRYERPTKDEDWELTRSYYFVKDLRRVEKVEENIRFINFVFPPQKNITWDGNKYIEAVENLKYLKDWNYRFTDVDVNYNVLGNAYQNVAHILLQDKENAIEKIYAKESYARGIGLIYKEWWHLETQNISDDPWEEKAQKGFIAKMQVLSYGKE